jgi:hypothetical protein
MSESTPIKSNSKKQSQVHAHENDEEGFFDCILKSYKKLTNTIFKNYNLDMKF